MAAWLSGTGSEMKRAFIRLVLLAIGITAGAWTHGTAVIASYVGPGNIKSGALAWGGLRCYSNAYSGNVADIYAPADVSHTLLTCSAGGTINETIQALATTCAVSCTVKTLYDQSGGTNCSGAPCTWVQATEANRPNLILNITGNGRSGMRFGGGAQNLASPSISLAQPWTISAALGKRTLHGGNFDSYLVSSTAAGLLGNASANTVIVYGGSTGATAAVTDNAWHSIQAVFNTTASSAYVDTTTTSSLSAGTASMAGPLNVGKFGSVALSGDIFEVGLWAGTFSGPEQIAMGANQHGSNGYSF